MKKYYIASFLILCLVICLGWYYSSSSLSPSRKIASSNQDTNLFQCLDRLEQSDRFYLHAGFLYALPYYETFIGSKKMKMSEIYEGLREIGYFSKSKREDLTLTEQQQKMVNAFEEFKKKDMQISRQIKNTSFFSGNDNFTHELDSAIIWSSTERDDRLTPQKPAGLLATRKMSDGQYAYFLAEDFIAEVKLPNPVDGNLFFLEIEEDDSKNYQVAAQITGENVDVVFYTAGNSRSWIKGFTNDYKFVDGKWKFTPNLVSSERSQLENIGSVKINKYSNFSDDTRNVLTEEINKIMDRIEGAFSNQLQMIRSMQGLQLEALKDRFGPEEGDPQRFAEGLKEHLEKALQECSSVESVRNKAQDILRALDDLMVNNNFMTPNSIPESSGDAPSREVRAE